MKQNTAKLFALQLGSLVSLYVSLTAFLILVFGLINLLFPDPLEGYWQIESSASMVRVGFAMTAVFFTAYLWLTRNVNVNRRLSKDKAYLEVTKWLIYLSLLIGGGVLLIDMVVVITGFLEGELTTRFFLKAAAVFVVIGSAVTYYTKDAQGYWLSRPWASIMCGVVSTAVILTILIAAVAHIETPTTVREMKQDDQIINDLRDMQWRIEDYYQVNGVLPPDLDTLYGEFVQPVAPEGVPAYQYFVASETGFKLCTTFTHDMRRDSSSDRLSSVELKSNGNHNWDYESGEWCFNRVVVEDV